MLPHIGVSYFLSLYTEFVTTEGFKKFFPFPDLSIHKDSVSHTTSKNNLKSTPKVSLQVVKLPQNTACQTKHISFLILCHIFMNQTISSMNNLAKNISQNIRFYSCIPKKLKQKQYKLTKLYLILILKKYVFVFSIIHVHNIIEN